MKDTSSIPDLPESFGRLGNLRYFELQSSGIRNIFPSICNLTNLEVIWFTGEIQIDEIPQCMDRLQKLRLLIIDTSYALSSFPLSLLTLPDLRGFSVSRADITWDSLLDGTLPSDVDRNDADELMQWLDEYFVFSIDTEYYLALNPICRENLSILIPRISTFIEKACEYPAELTDIPQLKSVCPPWNLGNGVCNTQCNDVTLNFDMGDCIQL